MADQGSVRVPGIISLQAIRGGWTTRVAEPKFRGQ
jgi:hypothetical protein